MATVLVEVKVDEKGGVVFSNQGRLFDRISADDFKNGTQLLVNFRNQVFTVKVKTLNSQQTTFFRDPSFNVFSGQFFQERFEHLQSSREFFAKWLNVDDSIMFEGKDFA